MSTHTTSFDDRITQIIAEAGLVQPENRFFADARSVERVEPVAGLRIALQWQAMTRAFMFTTLSSLGLLAREYSTGAEPDREVLGAYQTAFQVIGDNLANLAPEFAAVSPKGVNGVHYVWWADSIVAPLERVVPPAEAEAAATMADGVAGLIANMRRLAEEPLGAAVQLRVVEAIAHDIAVAFRQIYTKLDVGDKKLYGDPGALDWIDSHIKAETSHAGSVSDHETGMTAMVVTEEQRAEFEQLALEYTGSWAKALDDFGSALVRWAPVSARATAAFDADRVVEEVNRLRGRVHERRESFREPGFLSDLADQLTASPELAARPVVRALVDDLREFTPGVRLSRTKALVNASAENTIFGLFDASYFPSLSLEFLTYRTLHTDSRLAERYPSPTMPVVIERKSAGFASRTVVALFPENHLDGSQQAEDLVFYFIDKFVERHLRITRTLLDEIVDPEAFALVRVADETALEAASAWWVHLHEYHHRQGDMPIPEYLSAKKSKALAGLEELRTDVSSMLACLDDDRLDPRMAALAYQFVLAERLLRYSVEGKSRPNYDAVASQMLFTYLTEAGGIAVIDGRIHLRPELPDVLRAFLKEITDTERLVHEHPVDHVKAELLSLANRYTDFDAEAGDYRHIPFFADAKRRLGL